MSIFEKTLTEDDNLFLQVYEKGEEIALVDCGIWVVVRGVVQLSKVNHYGREIVVGWASASSSFSNWGDESCGYRVVALSRVDLRFYSLKQIEKEPLLARRLLAQLNIRLIESDQFLMALGHKKLEERLWQLLLVLKQEIGQVVTEGTRLQIYFTHQNLAALLSTTRVSITRILGKFRQQGWIELDSERHIIVKHRAVF